MKTGAQVGLAVVAGYVLGRFHKGKWALALAAMGAGKKLPGPQAAVLEQGKKLLVSNPVLGNLTQEVRSQLVGAGRTALTSAASRKIESFSEALRERSDLMRGTSSDGSGEETEDEGGSKRRSAADSREAADSGEKESGARPARRSTSQSRKTSGSGSTRKPRSTSSASSSSSERSSGRQGSSTAGPRKRAASSGQRAASSGQEPRSRRRSTPGSDQKTTAASRKRSRSSSSG